MEHQSSTDTCQSIQNNKSNLHDAAKQGNILLVQNLIDSGMDINARNCNQETPLMLAVKHDHEYIIILLLKAKADACIPDSMGKCILARAIDESDREISNSMRRIVIHNVTSESILKSPYAKTRDFRNHCPLHNDYLLKNYDLTKALLQAGSPVNLINNLNGKTLLHQAVEDLDLDRVKLLIEYNADVNARGYLGQKPLDLIPNFDSSGKILEIIEVLIKAGTTLIDQDYSDILVQSILSTGNRQVIRMVLEQNIDLFERDDSSRMPIEYLFENRNPGICEEVKHFKIDLDIDTQHLTSLLLCASAKGNFKFVELLLERNANVNSKDRFNRSPLFVAVNPMESNFDAIVKDHYVNRFNCIGLLLEFGADPQILTEDIDYDLIRIYDHPGLIDVANRLMKPVLIHLALHEASGKTIKQFMLDEIEKRQGFKNTFDSYRQQLDELKSIKIDGNVNLFDFLIVKKVSTYAENIRFMSNLNMIMRESKVNSYYYFKLQQNFLRLCQLVAINDIFVQFYGVSVIEIADQIVEYICTCNFK